MNIFLNKKYVFGKECVSDEALMVYVALRRFYQREINNYYVSMNMIYYNLFGKFDKSKNNRYIIEKLKIGLNELINIGIVSYVSIISPKEFILDLTKIEYDTSKAKETKEYFVIIDDTEIFKIMNCDNANKFKLCRYFIYLVGTFNNSKETNSIHALRNDVGYSPLEYMVDQTEISENTIINYNTLLEELKLIYIYKAPYIKRNNDGEINGITNTYGRYKNKELVEKAGISHLQAVGYDANEKRVKKANGKRNRSYSMKYNSFCSGKKYDYDTLKEMYETLVEYNKNLVKQYKSDKYKKDLTVFKDYDFYVDEDSVEISSPKVENEPAPQNSAKVQVIHKTENEDNSEDDEVSEEDYKNYLDSMVEIDIDTLDDDD